MAANTLGLPVEAVAQKMKELESAEVRRQRQQGLSRPIISCLVGNLRVVTVGNQLCWSEPGKWKTFHDFLFSYLRRTLGGEWAEKELRSAPEVRHPLLNWYEKLAHLLRDTVLTPGAISSAPATGAASAFLFLSYDLYLIAHNVSDETFHNRLFERLKHREHFLPAAYEVHVAAMLIQAGFDLKFEDESDSSRKHCEFTATYRATGKQFSVEAKMRQPEKSHADIGNQLYAALKKKADHARIVFIELNAPDLMTDAGEPVQVAEVLGAIRSREAKLMIDGAPAPPAYVAVTNIPYYYSLEAPIRRWGLLDGFKIPDFKFGSPFTTFRDARQARDRHIEVNMLQKSLQTHSWIPMTFSGEIPEVEFGGANRPLVIGRNYRVSLPNQEEIEGELLEGIVFEKLKSAICFFRTANGENRLVQLPLTDEEYAVYKADPTTFFGVVQPNAEVMREPLEIYDWFYERYRDHSKQQLLRLFANASDRAGMESFSQAELAELFCERMVEQIVAGNLDNVQKAKAPPLAV